MLAYAYNRLTILIFRKNPNIYVTDHLAYFNDTKSFNFDNNNFYGIFQTAGRCLSSYLEHLPTVWCTLKGTFSDHVPFGVGGIGRGAGGGGPGRGWTLS